MVRSSVRKRRSASRKQAWGALLLVATVAAAGALGALTAGAAADDDGAFVPRRQSEMPGPPLGVEEAQARMTVPEGFEVELVAAEPDFTNPVAMTIDAKGRYWIAESVEYPRREAGPGRDRIVVLEDTTGDGRVDETTTFADGLNIPSAIAVGHGGVWVANAPDILFMQDTTGDGKADHIETVVTGFDRNDTHELPNSFTWGPDGWLYGLHGVFNYSRIEQGDQTFEFDAAVFRIHPVTHEFQLFAEGTSNPWGLAFDPDGNMFISACVIDHLWHITESGYYVRQAGAYPPFTWRIGSIVDHTHQKAAYCGLVYFDSEAYPEAYRDTLYMGNIHGGAINADVLQRRGSTYFATPRDDLLTANDVWFMPVSQEVGPDGLLYVLDWYDRYHCYQDARRDPEGVDRKHGRLWRLRHTETEAPSAPFADMTELSDDALIEHLHSRNVYHRETAQRLLAERLLADEAGVEVRPALRALVLDDATAHKPRMHALFALVSSFELSHDFHAALLEHEHPSLRAWGVRAAGNFAADAAAELAPALHEAVLTMTDDPSPDVQLQVAIAAPKLEPDAAVEPLAAVLGHAGDDPLIPHIAWENLHPLLARSGGAKRFLEAVAEYELDAAPGLRAVMPRVTERVLAVEDIDVEVLTALVRLLIEHAQHAEAGASLAALAERVRSGEIDGERLERVREHIEPVLEPILRGDPADPLFLDAAATAATWSHASAVASMHRLIRDDQASVTERVGGLEALVSADDAGVIDLARSLLADADADVAPGPLKRGIIRAISRLETPAVGDAIVHGWATYDTSTRTVAIETLTQRPVWSVALLDAIADGDIDRRLLNLNQVRTLLESDDERIADRVEQIYGRVRTGRDPDRERIIAEAHELAQRVPGDPTNGRAVFNRNCASCHVIHGEGAAVGPDITDNGRGSFEQLLSNVLDPNLIINPAYQLRTITTTDGRSLAGMIVEETDQRLVVQMIGDQREVIARDRVADVATVPVSFMPEGLENAMSEQELIDLLAFLSLTGPPEDPDATLIPGAPVVSELDADRLHVPSSVSNLLSDAELSSNVAELDRGLRGEIGDMIWQPPHERFARDSQWHEWGVGFGEDLGVVDADAPVYWQAQWDQPVRANFIVFSGAYPNQPQPETAWKIELRHEGVWTVHDEGIGGWYDGGRYVWGGAGRPPTVFDALRVSVFSSDDETPIESVHFRGEAHVSWIVADVAEDIDLQK